MRVLMYTALIAITMASVMAAHAQPFNDQSLCTASTCVSREQRLESCTAVINAGAGTTQNLAFAFNNRGNVYLNLKDYDRAIADYNRAIELTPQYALAFSNRGAAYRNKGRYDSAIQDYDHAIQIIPNYANTFLADARQDKAQWDFNTYLNEGQYEDLAIRDYDEAIRLNPKNAAAFNNRGNLYVSKRMYDRAIQDFNEALRLNPDNGPYLKNRGNAFRIIGQYQRAIADFRKALSLNIDQPIKRQLENALKDLGLAG